MSLSESPVSAAGSAMGFAAVLMRVHEPVFTSIFWLALGCVLVGPDAVCVMPGQAQGASGLSLSHIGAEPESRHTPTPLPT